MGGVRLLVRWVGWASLAILPWSASTGREFSRAAATQAPSAASSPVQSIAQLAWMTGGWTGTMGKAGIEEHWIAPAGKTMLGVSRMIVGDRTVAFEFLRIEQRPDGIVYLAQPSGRPPTEFRLTKAGATSVTFENPQHDHPKVIRYSKQGDGLVAEVEGDEKGKRITQKFTLPTRVCQ
jgi:Domain of unknown function (DUF6265)